MKKSIPQWLSALEACEQASRRLDALRELRARGGDLGETDGSGFSLAMHCAMGGDWRCIRKLSAWGIDLSAANVKGMTPALFAALMGEEKVLRELALAGASFEGWSPDGKSVRDLFFVFYRGAPQKAWAKIEEAVLARCALDASAARRSRL